MRPRADSISERLHVLVRTEGATRPNTKLARSRPVTTSSPRMSALTWQAHPGRCSRWCSSKPTAMAGRVRVAVPREPAVGVVGARGCAGIRVGAGPPFTPVPGCVRSPRDCQAKILSAFNFVPSLAYSIASGTQHDAFGVRGSIHCGYFTVAVTSCLSGFYNVPGGWQ